SRGQRRIVMTGSSATLFPIAALGDANPEIMARIPEVEDDSFGVMRLPYYIWRAGAKRERVGFHPFQVAFLFDQIVDALDDLHARAGFRAMLKNQATVQAEAGVMLYQAYCTAARTLA